MQRLYITREQLQLIAKDQRALRALEDLFDDVNELIDINVADFVALAIGGDARATQAVASIEALAQALGVIVSADVVAEQLRQAIKDLQNIPIPAKENVIQDLVFPAIDYAAIENNLVGLKPYFRTLTFADSPYTATHDYEILTCDATGGNITVNTMGAKDGRQIWVKKTDASVNVVSVASADNIDGAATFDLVLQYESVTAVSSSGTYWAM